MNKECLWYNGEQGIYHLLDFDPNGLTKAEIIEKAKERIRRIAVLYSDEDIEKELSRVYLIDINNLKEVKLIDEKKGENKYFLLLFTVYNGESEYKMNKMIQAKSEEEAEEEAGLWCRGNGEDAWELDAIYEVNDFDEVWHFMQCR